MFNKKIVYSTKVEERFLILRNIILGAAYSFFLSCTTGTIAISFSKPHQGLSISADVS